jgi:hypothetical protein
MDAGKMRVAVIPPPQQSQDVVKPMEGDMELAEPIHCGVVDDSVQETFGIEMPVGGQAADAEVFASATPPVPTNADQHTWTEDEFRQAMRRRLELTGGDLTVDQKAQLLEVMVKHRVLWTKSKLGSIDFEYDIEVTSWQNAIHMVDKRWSPKEVDVIRQEVETLLAKGFVEPARSPWAARLVLVPKADGSTRVCVDYRKLNEVTIADAYPTPRVDHVMERLGGNCFFTTLDCEKGYYQVQLSERTKDITAFLCPMGQFRWTCMPFGLRNAPAVFQRLMDLVLSGLTWEMCMVFFDDVIVFSRSWGEHLQHLDQVFTRMVAAGMTLNFKKVRVCSK